MSSATPTHVLQQAVALRDFGGYIIPTKDFRTYMLDLNGWFMWNGESYEMEGKSIGAGLTRLLVKPKVYTPTAQQREVEGE